MESPSPPSRFAAQSCRLPSSVSPWLLRAFWRRGTSPPESPRLRGARSGCGQRRRDCRQKCQCVLGVAWGCQNQCQGEEANVSTFMAGAAPRQDATGNSWTVLARSCSRACWSSSNLSVSESSSASLDRPAPTRRSAAAAECQKLASAKLTRREPAAAKELAGPCARASPELARGPAARGMLPTVSAQKRNVEAIISVERQRALASVRAFLSGDFCSYADTLPQQRGIAAAVTSERKQVLPMENRMPKLSLTFAAVLTMGLCFAQSGAYAQTAEDAPPLAAEPPEAAEEPEAPLRI